MNKKTSILIAFLFMLSLFAAGVSATSEKIVLLALDDFQVWWLEDIQEQIVQTHIDNNIPVTLGVIPSGIEDPWGAGDRIIERMQRWDAYSFIEVAQHGYDHEVFLEGMTYNNQYSRLRKGNDLMKSIGIYPTSLVPPFGSADANTVQVLKELGFHTLHNPIEMEPISDPDILIIQDQLHLCKNNLEGRSSVFKDYNTIVSEIESKINTMGVALVLYHMQDFESSGGSFNTNKANQLVSYVNQLKQDGYTLMTVEQYYQYQLDECVPEPEVCDGLDNDCDGLIDEDYNIGEKCAVGVGACYNEGTYICSYDGLSTECNAVPGQPSNEICDGIDNDCDALIDEDYIETATSCGIGICSSTGLLQCIAGREVDSCVPGAPEVEICDNQLDDDCDGKTDLEDSDCSVPVCACKGDLNQDNMVNLEDIVILVNNLNSNPSGPSYEASAGDCADFDGNGEVNTMDLFLLLVGLVPTSDWSYSC